MNRKQFLRRSALFTLAAAGLSNKALAFGTGLESWYVSEKAVGANGLFYVYDTHARNSDLLLTAADAPVKLLVSLYAYPNTTTKIRSSGIYLFHRRGAPAKDGEYDLLSFDVSDTVTGADLKQPHFPKTIRVKLRADKELLLETTEDNFTTLSFQKDPDDGCFLTTACTEARGLPDDCAELQALRYLRDGHMMTTPADVSMIHDYYRAAPGIVKNINNRANRQEIWDLLYTDLVLPAKQLVERDLLTAAAAHYSMYVSWVKELFG